MGASILYLRKDTHPLDDLQCWTEEVDGMAAAAETQLFGPLHDGRSESEPVEPVRQYRASNTGAGNQHAWGDHRHVISLRICG